MLHAGLCHGSRRQGRGAILWNVACDFVINDWLVGMGLGTADLTVVRDHAFLLAVGGRLPFRTHKPVFRLG